MLTVKQVLQWMAGEGLTYTNRKWCISNDLYRKFDITSNHACQKLLNMWKWGYLKRKRLKQRAMLGDIVGKQHMYKYTISKGGEKYLKKCAEGKDYESQRYTDLAQVLLYKDKEAMQRLLEEYKKFSAYGKHGKNPIHSIIKNVSDTITGSKGQK